MKALFDQEFDNKLKSLKDMAEEPQDIESKKIELETSMMEDE